MTRFVPVTMLVVLLASSGVAGAQAGGGSGSGGLGPNMAQLTFTHLQVWDGAKFIEPEVNDRPKFFNLAHCNCAQAAKSNAALKDAGTFKYLVQESTQSGVHQPVHFFAGPSCNTDDTQRNNNCVELPSAIPDVEALNPGGTYQPFNLYDIVNVKSTMQACLPVQSATIWAFVSTQGNGTFDYNIAQNVGVLSTETSTAVTGLDTVPPPAAANPTALPDEGGIVLTWTAPASNSTDVAYYQALCAKTDDSPARAQAADARYVTTASICNGVDPPMAEQPTAIGLDNGEAAATPGGNFARLDEEFICGETSGTATSLQIKDLQNDTKYKVILMSVDLHGNFTAQYFDHTITPHLVTDFWEDLHDKGSKAEGGLCLIAETYGDDSPVTRVLRGFRDDTLGASRAGRWLTGAYYATLGTLGGRVHGSTALRVVSAIVLAPAVALALVWHWLGLPALLALLVAAWWLVRRRRAARRRQRAWAWLRAPAIAAAGVVVLGAGDAHAGNGGYQPYWENGQVGEDARQEAPPGDPSLVDWHVGLRLSPYVPDIDSQINTMGAPGPYAQMFGGYHILPMIDVDRILWTGFGQLGVGVSLGYWQKTARPFTMGSSKNDPDRPREPGNKNAFRLIPTELTAVYRFTALDDAYGIPIVPYVRGGLAYYVWWITAPNGNYARICDDNGNNCSNKALGASLGVRGAVGLAIRAERIDASAAMSMQNSGIQHAGIYGELSLAKVDGFGSDSKLSVGATTWFAGVDFEF